MTSPYNTRSTRSASASSITILPETTSVTATTTTQQRRHFCIVLTNNPRMIQSAGRMLQNVTLNAPTEQGRREQQPQVQMQYLQVPAPIRTRRRPVDAQVEQQVPLSAQGQTTTIIATNIRAHEKETEEDFQAQIQPILQLY